MHHFKFPDFRLVKTTRECCRKIEVRTTQIQAKLTEHLIVNQIKHYPQGMPISQEVPRVGKFFCHLYTFLISVDASDLDVLSKFGYYKCEETSKTVYGNRKKLSYRRSIYMWVRIKIQFQLSLVIFPEVIYYNASPMIFHQVKLKSMPSNIIS